MIDRQWIKLLLSSFVMALFMTGCQAVPKHCLPGQSISCKKALSEWQSSIDAVVKSNFPGDYGMYKATVWEEEFDNAWVTKGRRVNITKRFLNKLSPIRRICVAAHEIAHLKMGHYYSRIGIIIVNSDSTQPITDSPIVTSANHYGTSSMVDTPEGFGVNQEVEADRMAIKLIKKLGLKKNHYLDLLLLLQGEVINPNSLIHHRINMAKQNR